MHGHLAEKHIAVHTFVFLSIILWWFCVSKINPKNQSHCRVSFVPVTSSQEVLFLRRDCLHWSAHWIVKYWSRSGLCIWNGNKVSTTKRRAFATCIYDCELSCQLENAEYVGIFFVPAIHNSRKKKKWSAVTELDCRCVDKGHGVLGDVWSSARRPALSSYVTVNEASGPSSGPSHLSVVTLKCRALHFHNATVLVDG